jgi:hypothetical protein
VYNLYTYNMTAAQAKLTRTSTAVAQPDQHGAGLAIGPGEIGNGGDRPGTIDQTADWSETLYRPEPTATVAGTITAIPYFAWANREPGAMLVWLRDGR